MTIPAKKSNVGTGTGQKDESAYKNVDVEIVHQGREITLPLEPAPMTLDEALVALKRKRDEQEAEVAVHELVDAFPWDGAIAFFKAMRQIFGWGTPKPKMTFFGPQPPAFMSVETDYNEVSEFIWGQFTVPGVWGQLECAIDLKDGRQVFCIKGITKRKDHHKVKELADLTRVIVREQSIYRGKPFRLWVHDNGSIDMARHPSFIDVSKVRPEELIFPDTTEEMMQTNLFTPITKTDACRKYQIPLRRGILLEGPYGVGKTLAAAVVAKLCRENGWTFIAIDKVAGLKTAIHFAKLYAPAVVFSEDIDRAISGARTVQMDDILNTIDGVAGKSDEIITCLTTNAVENINQAMLRPGRLDAVISIRPPDAQAVERLMRLYARGRIDAKENLTEPSKVMEGQIPAVIREAVERSKLSAIRHGRTTATGELAITSKDLLTSSKTLVDHIELLKKKDMKAFTTEEVLGRSLTELLLNHVDERRDTHDEWLDQVVTGIAINTRATVPPKPPKRPRPVALGQIPS